MQDTIYTSQKQTSKKLLPGGNIKSKAPYVPKSLIPNSITRCSK